MSNILYYKIYYKIIYISFYTNIHGYYEIS